jgi:hypothetical protein
MNSISPTTFWIPLKFPLNVNYAPKIVDDPVVSKIFFLKCFLNNPELQLHYKLLFKTTIPTTAHTHLQIYKWELDGNFPWRKLGVTCVCV